MSPSTCFAVENRKYPIIEEAFQCVGRAPAATHDKFVAEGFLVVLREQRLKVVEAGFDPLQSFAESEDPHVAAQSQPGVATHAPNIPSRRLERLFGFDADVLQASAPAALQDGGFDLRETSFVIRIRYRHAILGNEDWKTAVNIAHEEAERSVSGNNRNDCGILGVPAGHSFERNLQPKRSSSELEN